MHTAAAARARSLAFDVGSVTRLVGLGWTHSQIAAQVRAGRWQRVGRAVVLHNGVLTPADTRAVVLVNAGPRSVLTSFTSLAAYGLTGWERDAVHVLVPAGARVVRTPDVPMRVHWTGRWPTRHIDSARRVHRPAQSAILAGSAFANPRSACGVLAAAVQQRVVDAGSLATALAESRSTRHHAVLTGAVNDIGQGSQALSEIDFVQLCRSAGLPEPVRQAVRLEPSGRRRYLDAEWRQPRGRRVVVEIDGALHLSAQRWWNDQLRQNELVISGDRVLRFPSVVLRCEPELILDQLRRALL